MSYLPDKITKELVGTKQIRIDPYFDTFQGPNLYYCHLGNRFLYPKKDLPSLIDPLKDDSSELYEGIITDEPISIPSGAFLLAELFEYLGTSEDYVIRLFNSSSLARVGISQAAIGMINPGCGHDKPIKLTLELVNNFPRDVVLTPTTITKNGEIKWGTEVLKIAVSRMDEKPSVSYSNWKHAVYHVDQKAIGPKMKGRFGTIVHTLSKDSLHRKVI